MKLIILYGPPAVEEDIAKIEAEMADLATERKATDKQEPVDMEKMKAYVRYFLEHLEELLLSYSNPVLQAKYFGVIFNEAPTYQDIVSGIPDCSELTSVNEAFKSKKSSKQKLAGLMAGDEGLKSNFLDGQGVVPPIPRSSPAFPNILYYSSMVLLGYIEAMAHKTERLEGKRALITGGSRGIGKAIAERFCEEGAAVIITGRSSGNGAQTAGQLRRTGYDVHFEEVEVTNTSSIETMVGRAVAQLNGIDVLVNNAGILDVRSIRKLNVETWDTVIATNLTAPVFCMRSVAAYMAERGEGGSIINMASIAGIDCGPGLASYAASKAGVIAATQVAAKEFARDHIRVNAVAPGVIDTDMTSVMSDRARQASTDNTPLGRMGLPEDIAGATVFLASGEAAFVTGQTLRIDGGLSL